MEKIFPVTDADIETLDLSVRVINGCRLLGIKTLFDLIKKSNDPLFFKIFGRKSLAEINAVFLKNGFYSDRKHFNFWQAIFSLPIINN